MLSTLLLHTVLVSGLADTAMRQPMPFDVVL